MHTSSSVDWFIRAAALDERCTSLSSLEMICGVVERSLARRFRGIARDAVRDAVQEATCRLCEQRGFRSEVNPRTMYSWMYTTASRVLVHTLRRDITAAVPSEEGETGQMMTDLYRRGESGRDDDSEQLNNRLTCNALLEKLSRNLASAARLHFEGYTADEIAQRLGCTRAAAHKRVQRACSELRAMWQREELRVRDLLV